MLIINGNIHTMEGVTYERGFVRVQGGVIAGLGPMTEAGAAAGEETLDAGGSLVLPGFVDGHTHIGMFEDGLGFEGDDGNEDTDPVTPQLRAVDAVNPMERSFQEALEAGITTVVTGPGSANPIGGQICALKTAGRCVDDMLVDGFLGMKFALGENPKNVYNMKAQTPITRMATASLIRDMLGKAREYWMRVEDAAEDEDAEEPDFDAKCEAMLPVLRGEKQAHFHAHRADDIFTAIRIAEEFQLDYVLIHCTEGYLIAEELKRKGAKAIAGPLFATRGKPELRNYSAAGPGVLAAAGIPVAICTDHPEFPQQFLALSAGLAACSGMDRLAALESITIAPARICGLGKRVGSLAKGKDADILVFERDPFELGALPAAVIAGGRRIR